MASSSVAGPSATSPASALALLTNLPISHPSFSSLLVGHTPLASSSSLPHQPLNKLLGRINTAILSRENESDRRIGWGLAREVIHQDSEGYALLQYGKGWVTASIAAVTATSHPSAYAVLPLRLLASLIFASSTYPSFEREGIHPVMGKVAVSLSRLLERTLVEGDWNAFGDIAPIIKSILQHSPASFRPIAPNMRNLLRAVTLSLPPPSVIPEAATTVILAPWEIRQTSADLLAALPITAGKAQSPAAWGVAMRESLGGIGEALNGITRDGWEEEAIKVTPPVLPAGLPALPTDPATRLSPSLDWLEGFTEETLALLSYPTSRPVPIPIAQIVSAGLRCLNLTLDTPTVAYISPLHQAALLSALPRVWTTGILLLAGVVTACGDHVLPHLSSILDHSVWLAERTPLSMHQTHLQLLQFHHMLFTLYPPALSPVDFPTRLLRSCLSRYSALLSSDRSSPPALAANVANGKRGKKRARGAEDGLIGGLEGRDSRAVSQDTVQAVLASLKLAVLLHSTPLLAPSLLTFSIRLHLSLYLHLSTTSSSSFESPLHLSQLRRGARDVLEEALYLVEGEQGTSRGWKSAVLSVLNAQGDRVALLLHPSVPPAHRPQPPLNALHYFTKETEEERKLRRELGYSTLEDAVVPEVEDEDHDMAAEQPTTVQIAVPTAISTLPRSQPSAAAPLAAQTTVQTVSAVSEATSAPPPPIVPRTLATPPEVAAASTEPPAAAVVAVESFISTSTAVPTTSGLVEKVTHTVTEQYMDVDDDDEPLPELDSGSSDEDGDEDEGDDDDVEEEEA